ncbi:hypothetical protein ACFL6W_03855 [Thermodesulfobacteriota bacterium]
MTPLSFEWQWNIEYLVFFGLLYIALTIIGCGATYTFIKSWLDLRKDKDQDLPAKIEQREKYKDY